jgi:hypothetical protein
MEASARPMPTSRAMITPHKSVVVEPAFRKSNHMAPRVPGKRSGCAEGRHAPLRSYSPSSSR